MRTWALAAVVCLLCAGPALGQPRLTMQWRALAEQLVTQLAPQPGERILLVARPGQFDALTVVPCPPPAGLEASLDRSGSDFSARLASEVVRLERYAAKGDIRHEEVPAAIRSLAARIREKHPLSGVGYP